MNMTVCFLLGNTTFWIVPWVSHTRMGLLHPFGSFTPIRVFHTHSGLLHPFGSFTPIQKCLTHIDYFSLYYLNYASLLGVVPKTNSTHIHQECEQLYCAPTPDLTQCHCAHECNDANSYIQFQWLTLNYISYNSNIHVNTSISMH